MALAKRTEASKRTDSSKDRLLVAATNLMNAGEEFSTRDVLAAAGVTAPTLYHHFGSKQGLVDAVAMHGLTQYVTSTDLAAKPIEAIRRGWDRHVEFGLDHPAFYARLYGNIEPGKPCSVTSPAIDMMLVILEPAASAGDLVIDPVKAAHRILAANVGVTLSLIGQETDQRDMELSAAVREAVLDAVFVQHRSASAAGRDIAAQAVALSTRVTQDSVGLSEGERALLLELLDRVAAHELGAPRQVNGRRTRHRSH